jgi:OmpA-OmpF porin, OOP family
MKVKLYQFGLIAAAFVLLFAALPAHAANKYGSIYAVSPFGEIVRDPFGNCIRTPQWTPEKDVPECGAVVAVEPPAPVVETLTLGAETLFAFDRADLKPEGRARLDQLVNDLRRVTSVSSISIVGHTDSKGTLEYNFRLGQRRADTVASYLVNRGVPSQLISTDSRSFLEPVAPNTFPDGRDNPEGRALNRRVVITVTAMEKVITY